MILSHNTEKEINFTVAKKYGSKWITKRIIQEVLAQIALGLLAFFIYKALNWGGLTLGSDYASVFVFVFMSLGSIGRNILSWEKDYTEAKILWVTDIMNEFARDREIHNYGEIASMLWEQRIEMCKEIINSLKNQTKKEGSE